MTDQLSGNDAAKAIGDPLGTFVGWLAGLLPEGPAKTLLYVVAGLCVVAAPFIYRYYLGVLAQGAAPEGSLERQDYDKLRAGLAGDNLAARLYAKWLTAFLDGVERFFGDAGMGDRTLFPHAFGLKKPAPLWTAPAFDRCLLLALIYPIATIFFIWAITGHVGPAENALGLDQNVWGWSRSLAVAASFGIIVSPQLWRALPVPTWASTNILITIASILTFLFVAVITVILFIILIGAAKGMGVFVSYAFITACYRSIVGTFAGVGAIAVAFAVGVSCADAVSARSADSTTETIVAASVSLLAFLSFFWIVRNIAIRNNKEGLFLTLFIPIMILSCLAAADLLSPFKSWVVSQFGSLLLFVGLLTLLNAPFDWASLGLTRALLRRGLELGGWWPYFLAFADACLAGVIIALLALTMVIGVQAFDELAVHGGGEKAAVLPLDVLFDGIANNPGAPEYWWAYALLLSSMIPSLINLMISGMAFTRGIPWLARLLLNWIPEGKAVPEYKRQPAAIGLTVQMFAGAGLGIAAQAFLAWGLIFHIMPWIGLDLLDMARAVAAFDLPARISQLFVSVW